MHTTLVSTELLATHLGEWAIVDCRFDLQKPQWGRQEYRAAHVPGAVYLNLNDDLSSPPTGANGRHPLPSVDALVATFSRVGIDRGTQVVAYDQDAGPYASRLWWLLRMLGHEAVAVLDGGWAKWVREARPTRGGEEQRQSRPFGPAASLASRVEVSDVAAATAQGSGMLLIDARAAERFEGRSETIDRVAGHIPGALNHFYKDNLTADATMLPPETLKQRFGELLGSAQPADVIMYCGSGVTACHNLLAMEHAGLKGARLYVGSWSEWSSDPARPIETGRSRKT